MSTIIVRSQYINWIVVVHFPWQEFGASAYAHPFTAAVTATRKTADTLKVWGKLNNKH